MRRFAMGRTTDSHQLYSTFMIWLSHCIFMWDQEDRAALQKAKRAELKSNHKDPSDADVLWVISRSELALHCRRTTRGTGKTQALIESLIQVFNGDNGQDTLGVPLINSARASEIIKSQRKHVACIQDPPGVQLYLQTWTLVKSGQAAYQHNSALEVPTSLESFLLHLNRFIPGNYFNPFFTSLSC